MRLILFTTTLLVLAKADAQITLTEDWLMTAGFELELGVDTTYLDAEGNITAGGADQTWTFNDLDVEATTFVRALDASEGTVADSFPTADIVVLSGQAVGPVPAGAEVYMDRDADDLFVVGFATSGGLNPLPVVRLADRFTFQSSPQTYRDASEDEGGIQFTFGTEFLDSLNADSIGIDPMALGLVDSFRIAIGQRVEFEVDGYGALTLRDERFEALRVRSVTSSSFGIEAKVPIFNWVPLSQFVPGIDSLLGGPGANQALVSYSWLVREYSFPIVQVAVDDDDEPQSVTFATEAVSEAREAFAKTDLTLVRVGEELSITTARPEAAGARLSVFASDGRVVTQGSLSGQTASFSTHDWPAGTYTVSLTDGRRLLATRRVVVAR